MNKHLIAIALGTALLLPITARADVTVYGRAQVEFQKTKDVAPGSSVTTHDLIDNKMGRVGINAAEDLGDGMVGLAHFGFAVNTSNNSGFDDGRQSYVGISGGLGTVRLGRLAGVYKDTNLDPFIATTLEARAPGAGASAGDFGHDGFINDVVKYNKQLGKLKLGALATAGNATNGDSGDYQAALDYRGRSLRTILAYSRNKDASGIDTPADRRTKLAFQYALGESRFTLEAEKTRDYTPSGTDLGNVNFYLFSFYWALPNHNSLYFRTGQDKYKLTQVNHRSYMLAFTHRMSRTFRIWLGYIRTKDESTFAKRSITSFGMRKDF